MRYEEGGRPSRRGVDRNVNATLAGLSEYGVALRERSVLRLRRCRARTFQDDVDARDQIARAKRFRHVVVTADFEPKHAVDLLVTRRQEQDRHVTRPADLAADLQSVDFRHADV